MTKYYPEGVIYETKQNKRSISSVPALRESFFDGRILEAKAALCDGEHNLHVDLGGIKGIIPREECALGIAEGTTKDIAIVSRVNKPVVFKITDFRDDENGVRTAFLSLRHWVRNFGAFAHRQYFRFKNTEPRSTLCGEYADKCYCKKY